MIERRAVLADRTAIAISVAGLAAYDIARSAVIPQGAHFASNVALLGAVVVMCVLTRMTLAELGLARRALPAGLRVGLIVLAAIGVVVAIAVSVSDGVLSLGNDPTDLDAAEVWFQVALEIPLATVAMEELAFRGLLAALFERVVSPWRAVAAQALVFGLWHMPGEWSDGVLRASLIAGGTAAYGAVLHVMKRRTGSLAAPVLVHWSTNGLSLAIAWALT